MASSAGLLPYYNLYYNMIGQNTQNTIY